MNFNYKLAKQALDTIKANPKHWNQEQWHCGTAHCFAGFVELIVRDIPIDTPDEYFRYGADMLYDDYNLSHSTFNALSVDAKNIFIYDMEKLKLPSASAEVRESFSFNAESTTELIARHALGLSAYQAAELFDSKNTLEKIEKLINRWGKK